MGDFSTTETIYLVQDHDRVRIRSLDNELSIDLFGTDLITDIELICSELDNLLLLKFDRIKKVVVVENLTTFLSFPSFEKTLVIFGGGRYASSILLKSLNRVPLYYWGDLDVQGLEIMASFRNNHPNTISLLMDSETLESHSGLVIPGKPSQLLGPPITLSDAELRLYAKIATNNMRLEQEKIGRDHLENAIKKAHCN